MPPQLLTASGVAEQNLLQAVGLPHGMADEAEVERHLATLSAWAGLCRRETERAWGDFCRDPGYYGHSEATFRMMCVVTVVQRDLGVRYNPEAVGHYSFADARDCFLHGLLEERGDAEGGGRRLGTCVNIPVLYVALGRLLGYPVHLALAKGHVFARWQPHHPQKGGETVNLEATNLGLTTHPDSHYRQWPRPIADEEAGDYLRPLTPEEEEGLFVGTRGHCLQDNGRNAEALTCYERAAELQPRPLGFWSAHAQRLTTRTPASPPEHTPAGATP